MIDTRGDDVARRWSLRLVAGLLAGAVVLTGCSEKREASESLPAPSAPPTEEELPPLGPEDLPMPDEARTQDAAGAEAFVRYYIELINRTSDVMDAGPLREFSDHCRDCDRIANRVEEHAAAGYVYEGGGITLTRVGAPLLNDDTAELALQADLAALSVVDADGSMAQGLSAPSYSDLSGGAAIEWQETSGYWVMKALTLE